MMKSLLKWLGILIGVLLLLIAGFFVSMRFHDGPREIISGGPFQTGELAPTPDSWAFLKDRDTIQFQTLEPPTSRTIWLATHEGRLFLVSGYMNTTMGKIWKHWPHNIEDDNRVILRIDGKLYEQRLERIMDGPDVMPVLKEFARKYGFNASDTSEVDSGNAWLYEVLPRE